MIKDTRTLLQLTQEDLAMYLAVPFSVISMAESGLREMPFEKLKKLQQLRENYLRIIRDEDGKGRYKTPELLAVYDKLRADKNRGMEQKEFVVKNMRLELEEMTTAYEKAAEKLKGLDALRNELPDTAENKYEKQWLDYQWSKTISLIRKCNPAVQAQLRIKLELAEAEIKITQKVMKEYFN